MSSVLIIIPAFNEQTSLGRTLSQLALLSPLLKEIIVVDGGSEDETTRDAKSVFESFLTTVKTEITEIHHRGRSIQMNYAAEQATTDILCFVHADTNVPDDLIT